MLSAEFKIRVFNDIGEPASIISIHFQQLLFSLINEDETCFLSLKEDMFQLFFFGTCL